MQVHKRNDDYINKCTFHQTDEEPFVLMHAADICNDEEQNEPNNNFPRNFVHILICPSILTLLLSDAEIVVYLIVIEELTEDAE